jgi:cell fate regulator YaaT (PSP1 superfamily)
VCGTTNKDKSGCGNNGCLSGGCNRLNTFDWLTAIDVEDAPYYDLVEVSYRNGARKEFCKNPAYTRTSTGDLVVIDVGGGFDIGKISLSGELVRLQMKRKKVSEKGTFNTVLRRANDRDLEKLEEMRALEKSSMIRARVISRTLALNMKIGDVEFQADGRKATFYYTADGRVDFRELIRHFAKEFRVKIEMRQIGARQESARIGGLGSCGRELCCSTWLSDFKSVNTAAARYQNLAINQAKLSGQCGRLKCCLNYELDVYMESFEVFPKNADKIAARSGSAKLFKTDILKRLMFYTFEGEGRKGEMIALEPAKVKQILALNAKGEFPEDLMDLRVITAKPDAEEEPDFEDVTGAIELPAEKRRKRKKKRNKNRGKGGQESKDKRQG